MKININEMLELVTKVVTIYIVFHLFKVCFADEDIFTEEVLKNILGLTMAIIIYYVFFDNLVNSFMKIKKK